MSERIYSFEPIYDSSSRILILGTAPSVKSLEQGFFYMHPQNRFWRVLGKALGCDLSGSVEEKRRLLLEHRVALWDILRSREREGSLDAAIRSPEFNDIPRVMSAAPIRAVFCNGATSYRLTLKAFPQYNPIRLPSTSPANNGNFREQEWLKLGDYLR